MALWPLFFGTQLRAHSNIVWKFFVAGELDPSKNKLKADI